VLGTPLSFSRLYDERFSGRLIFLASHPFAQLNEWFLNCNVKQPTGQNDCGSEIISKMIARLIGSVLVGRNVLIYPISVGAGFDSFTFTGTGGDVNAAVRFLSALL
jgi:hypothetical protein